MKTIQIKQNGEILEATLNRPEAHNAINFRVMDELESLIERIESDRDVRALIFSGSGDTFIAGGDLKEFHAIKTKEKAREMAGRMHSILNSLEQLPCWTIAAVNGTAYGGGCEIMLAFDFCMAKESAAFSFSQGRFYLPPGWGGLTRLVERVGRPTALRWLAGRATVNSKTALAAHLIDKTCPDDSLAGEARKWAEKLSYNDREYISALKKGAAGYSELRREALQSEIEPFTEFWVDERHYQRVNDFINKDTDTG